MYDLLGHKYQDRWLDERRKAEEAMRAKQEQKVSKAQSAILFITVDLINTVFSLLIVDSTRIFIAETCWQEHLWNKNSVAKETSTWCWLSSFMAHAEISEGEKSSCGYWEETGTVCLLGVVIGLGSIMYRAWNCDQWVAKLMRLRIKLWSTGLILIYSSFIFGRMKQSRQIKEMINGFWNSQARW